MHQVLRLKNMLAKSWPQAALALIKARAHELEVSFLIRSIPTADSMVAANHQWPDVAISLHLGAFWSLWFFGPNKTALYGRFLNMAENLRFLFGEGPIKL